MLETFNRLKMKYLSFLRLMLLSVFLLSAMSAHAQNYTQTVRGRVIDVDSKSPLPGVSVFIQGSSPLIGGASDLNGNFRLSNVPVGRQTVKAVLLGYEEVVLINQVVTSGKETVLTIEMKEKMITSEAVEVVYERDKTKANNELVTNSARNFRSEETERYAGSRGDPSKMVANYAGVATGNDARNDIIVRGNSPLGVLWKLEGVEIPNPNHFSAQGATGGPVSILNNNVLGSSDFLTGAFPAEYGNKMAAVFDLKIRNGNNEKMEYTGQLGFNGLEAGIEGPLSKGSGGSFLVNYRYSTLEIFKALGISFGVSALPRYQDMTFKVHVPTAKAGVFTIWGIGGLSHIALLDSEKDSADWSFTDKGENLVFASGMGAGGLSHVYFFNEKLNGKLSLSLSRSLFQITLDTLSRSKEAFNVYKNRSFDDQRIANYTLTNKINSRHLLKAGVSFNLLGFDYKSTYYSRSYGEYRDQLTEKDNAGMLRSFIHWQWRLTEKITWNNGFHYQLFTLNSSSSYEPRSGLSYQFTPQQRLTIAFGEHSQTQPLIYYFFRSYPAGDPVGSITNRDLDFSRSRHYIAGYDLNFRSDYRMKIEGYYQDLYNLPVEKRQSSFSMINIGNDLEGIPLVDSLENKGRGYNRGGEFTVEKFFSKHWYILSSLSVYESKYRASDGVWRNTAFSGGYVYNLLGGYEIPLKGDNKLLAIDAKTTFAGGNRYTPVNVEESIRRRETVYNDHEAFSKKFADYSKVDLKVSLKLNQKKATQTIFISIENILNKKNVLRQIYDAVNQTTVTEYQLGLFPYAGYRIEF